VVTWRDDDQTVGRWQRMGFGATRWYRQAAEVAGGMLAAWVAVWVGRMLLKVDEIWSRMLLRGAIRVTEYAYFKIAVCVLREFTLP
jgi:hypothetical protein